MSSRGRGRAGSVRSRLSAPEQTKFGAGLGLARQVADVAALARVVVRELALVVQNLFDDKHVEWGASPNRAAFQRTAFVKATWRL